MPTDPSDGDGMWREVSRVIGGPLCLPPSPPLRLGNVPSPLPSRYAAPTPRSRLLPPGSTYPRTLTPGPHPGSPPTPSPSPREDHPMTPTPPTDRAPALATICATCGTPFTLDPGEMRRSRCTDCRPAPREIPDRGTPKERGYDERWRRLSIRARRAQPFCSDCGATDDLTADHTPEAWARREAGQSIRLEDVDVVCRPCNGKRGAVRGEAPNRWQRPSRPSA